MQTITEEFIYCSHCGAANQKSAVVCCDCEKKLNLKGSPLLDFLKDHIKDSLKGKVTDNLVDVIKNFLLSHLYGAVLALCIVATVCMNVYANLPPKGVESVRLHPQEAVSNTETRDDCQTFTEAALEEAFYNILCDYEVYAFQNARGDAEMSADEEPPTRSLDNLFANRTLPGYTYSATHDFEIGAFHTEIHNLSRTTGRAVGTGVLDFSTLAYNAGAKTALGKQLYKDGYTVVEINYNAYIMSGNVEPTEESQAYIIENATVVIPYHFTFVKVDDVWYIANDIRL